MHILIKQGAFMLLGILGFFATILYTQDQKGVVSEPQHSAFMRWIAEPGSGKPDISDLVQAVQQIQQANLTKIDLTLTMGDDQQPDAARYEYHLTFRKDAAQRIRKVQYSTFALRGGDLLDLEEYYDVHGELFYLEYVRFSHASGATEPQELTGKIYLRQGQPVENICYRVHRTPEGIVRARTQDMPAEYHLTVTALQKTLLHRLEGTLVRFRQRIQSSDLLVSRPASAIQQQYAQTVAFYEALSAVFDNEDLTGFQNL